MVPPPFFYTDYYRCCKVIIRHEGGVFRFPGYYTPAALVELPDAGFGNALQRPTVRDTVMKIQIQQRSPGA